MATWNPDNVVLTQKGNEVLSKVQAGVGKLTISRIVSGGGFVSPSQLYRQTEVTNIKQELTITKVITNGNGSELALVLSNAELAAEYDLYQLGVYVTHPDFTGEILYVISQCDTDKPDHIPTPDVTVATLSYSMYVEHSGTTNIQVTIDPAGTLTVGDLNQPGGVPSLSLAGKLEDSVIPDTIPTKVEVEKEMDTKPSYTYVVDNTNITQIIQAKATSPFWSFFSSPQGPNDNRCVYFVYPELTSAGALTGNVFVEAYDIVEFKSYVYYGTSTAVARNMWKEGGGGSVAQDGIFYASCATAAGTGAKVATVSREKYELKQGDYIFVNFTNANTATSVTINLNNNGAKSIVTHSLVAPTSAELTSLLSGYVPFFYDGTRFVMLECCGNATQAGSVKLSDSVSSTSGVSGGVAATPAAVKSAYDLANTKAPVASPTFTGSPAAPTPAAGTNSTRLATTAFVATAVANKSAKAVYTNTLPTSGWLDNGDNGFYITRSISGILASDNPIVGIVQTGVAETDLTFAENWKLVSRIVSAANSITVYCYGETPAVNLPIQILCTR